MKFDLVVFFLPQEKVINGGIISIFSLCKESRALLDGAKVVLCQLPGGEVFHKNDLFDNNEYILNMDELIRLAKDHKRALLHVPEFKATQLHYLLRPYMEHLKHLDISLNILNQNIEFMPSPEELADLFLLTSSITQTTAHLKSCSQQIADHYGLPTHLFSVHISPENYQFVPYEEKKHLILYSLDNHPLKAATLQKISTELPEYTLQEIKDLRFEDYKKLITQAKFVITFGEGFDGYLIEPTFSGGVSLAAYNTEFFPDASYKHLKNVFSSHKDMLRNIVERIKLLDSKDTFRAANQALFEKLQQIYSHDTYRQNIKEYYNGLFDYIPTREAVMNLAASAIRHKQVALDGESEQVVHLSKVIEGHVGEHEKLTAEITKLRKDVKEAEAYIEKVHKTPGWKTIKKLHAIQKHLTRRKHS